MRTPSGQFRKPAGLHLHMQWNHVLALQLGGMHLVFIHVGRKKYTRAPRVLVKRPAERRSAPALSMASKLIPNPRAILRRVSKEAATWPFSILESAEIDTFERRLNSCRVHRRSLRRALIRWPICCALRSMFDRF